MQRLRSTCRGGANAGVVLGAAAAVAVLLAGCMREPSRPLPPTVEIQWPSPPAQPRIAYVQEIATPRDIGIEPSLWTRLRHVVTGATDRRGMVRPVAVAISGSLLAVADPGAQGVHLFDRRRPSYKFISGCKGRRWTQPTGLAFLDDSLYLSDSVEGAVFVLTRSGDCVATWPISGKGRPTGLAADIGRGRLLVTDTTAHKLRILSREGNAMAEVGRRGTRAGEFNYPGWVTIDKQGRIYVADSLNFRIQILDTGGGVVATFGTAGDSPGHFARPKGVGIDSMEHVYVVDALFDAVQIFDQSGRLLLNFGERGTGPGQFWLPSGLTIDDRDFIYVADSYNKRVQVFRFLGGE